jgi:hypothetical protein
MPAFVSSPPSTFGFVSSADILLAQQSAAK